ncbi:hypothetical protein [Allisonella histaminiformans]|uniref:hypothetical protein n=1 Tax=Allisonella histaminiformans TaxID=209880 RepID=UPI0026EB88ED|nr:hypothetical protein [Allisonella histaminiformans]
MTWMSYAVTGIVIILFVLALRKTCRTIFSSGCHGGQCCCKKKGIEKKSPCCH